MKEALRLYKVGHVPVFATKNNSSKGENRFDQTDSYVVLVSAHKLHISYCMPGKYQFIC